MAFKKYFTLSFDDGSEYDKRLIPIIKRYGLGATFNLNAGEFGKQRRLVHINTIPHDEIKEVYAGFELALHGFHHEMYHLMSKQKVQESMAVDVQALSELVGYQIVGHAYPYGIATKAGEEFLRANGMLYARMATGKGSFHFPENPYRYIPTCWVNAKNVMELVDEFIQAEPVKENLLFMMWGHAHEFDYGLHKFTEEQLNRIFSKIAGHSDITYCTSKEAFEGHGSLGKSKDCC